MVQGEGTYYFDNYLYWFRRLKIGKDLAFDKRAEQMFISAPAYDYRRKTNSYKALIPRLLKAEQECIQEGMMHYRTLG